MSEHDALITGIGILSSLGEGADAHLSALTSASPEPVLERERFRPYTVHPLPEIDWSTQIAKRGDLRQMEAWQRLGTYTAGLALDDAALKGEEALLASMDLIVAAGGGERDEAVDAGVLEASMSRNDRDVLLNEKLTTELRPTLFLAQLSNLLAGNISIVHKVTGSSRTFMGEEGAGIAALETAVARIRSGQSSHILVGGAYNTEHPDHLLAYELAGTLHQGAWSPVWRRQEEEGGGLISGSGAAFLVIESRRHAESRGRKAYASISKVVSDRSPRNRGDFSLSIGRLLDRLIGHEAPSQLTAVSGASGAHAATRAEMAALQARPGVAIRGFSSLTGHLKEAQFPFATALAALSVHNGAAFSPFDPEVEYPADPSAEVMATTIGSRRYEGAALVAAA